MTDSVDIKEPAVPVEHVVAMLRERLYGAISCLATLAVLTRYTEDDTSGWSRMIDVAVTMGGLWAASLLADWVAHLAVHERVGVEHQGRLDRLAGRFEGPDDEGDDRDRRHQEDGGDVDAAHPEPAVVGPAAGSRHPPSVAHGATLAGGSDCTKGPPARATPP